MLERTSCGGNKCEFECEKYICSFNQSVSVRLWPWAPNDRLNFIFMDIIFTEKFNAL